MKCSLVLFLILICCTTASAARIYTGGAGDGAGVFEQGYGGEQGQVFAMHSRALSDPIVDITSYRLTGDQYDLTYDLMGIAVFPIISLQGTTLAPNSVSLHVYGQAPAGTTWRWSHCLNTGDGAVGDSYIMWSEVVGSQAISAGDAAWLSVDVTQSVQQDVSSGNSYCAYQFMAYGIATMPRGSVKFWASESGTGPYLEVVPEPSCILALACGLSGLGCAAWRKRK